MSSFSDFITKLLYSVILWRHVQYGVVQISKEKKIQIVVPLQEG